MSISIYWVNKLIFIHKMEYSAIKRNAFLINNMGVSQIIKRPDQMNTCYVVELIYHAGGCELIWVIKRNE